MLGTHLSMDKVAKVADAQCRFKGFYARGTERIQPFVSDVAKVQQTVGLGRIEGEPA